MIYSPKICFWNFYPAKAIGALGKLTLKNLRENYLFSVTLNTYHLENCNCFAHCKPNHDGELGEFNYISGMC